MKHIAWPSTIAQFGIYGACTVAICIAAVGFWASGNHTPILYSVNNGIWITSNDKVSTLIWTSLGTVLSAITVFCSDAVFVVFVKQRISQHGARIATIEAWTKLSSQKVTLSLGHWRLSLYTIAVALTTGLLTAAFTTLVTPTSVLLSEPLRGSEIDFNSTAFWDWYNPAHSNGGIKTRGCRWYPYRSPAGNVSFNTCPFTDPWGILASGVSAYENSLGINSTVRVIGTNFGGPTGGVLPLGRNGISAFSNIPKLLDKYPTLPDYSYSLIQQGITAKVSCEPTPNSPIEVTIGERIGVTNSPVVGGKRLGMSVQNYSINLPDCSNQQTAIAGSSGVACFKCDLPHSREDYVLHIRPFGAYADPPLATASPNLTCTIKLLLSLKNVSYSSTTGLFTSKPPEWGQKFSSGVPNETSGSVWQLFSLVPNSWGNAAWDAIRSVLRDKQQEEPLTQAKMADAVEQAIQGFIDIESTFLRMFYIANEAPGQRDITGNFTVLRVGYKGSISSLIALLPLYLVVTLTLVYISLGIRTNKDHVSNFDPTRSTSLILAAAAGGIGDALLGKGDADPDDKGIRKMKIRFEGVQGFRIMEAPISTDDAEMALLEKP